MGRFVLTTNAFDRLEVASDLLDRLVQLHSRPNEFRRTAELFSTQLRSVYAMARADYSSRLDDWWLRRSAQLLAEPDWKELVRIRNLSLKDRALTTVDIGDPATAVARFRRQLDLAKNFVFDCERHFTGTSDLAHSTTSQGHRAPLV
jgi:hypothetical protein